MTTATVAAVYDRRYSIDHARSRRSSSRSYPLSLWRFAEAHYSRQPRQFCDTLNAIGRHGTPLLRNRKDC